MSDIFPNKNPKLFGEAEDSIGIIDTSAVAGLTGDATLSEGGNTTTQQHRASTAGSSVTDRLTVSVSIGNPIVTFSNITTPPNSILIINTYAAPILTDGSTLVKNVVLRRDTSDLSSFTTIVRNSTTGAEIFLENTFIDINPPAGTFDYTLEEDDVNSFASITVTLMFIVLTDTHAAEIITTATATKQINSPDSHRTQQTEVIP